MKTCQICKGPIVKGYYESRAEYEKRKACGRDCGYVYRSQQRVIKRKEMSTNKCDHCGEVIPFKYGMSKKQYEQKKYCNQKCYAVAKAEGVGVEELRPPVVSFLVANLGMDVSERPANRWAV